MCTWTFQRMRDMVPLQSVNSPSLRVSLAPKLKGASLYRYILDSSDPTRTIFEHPVTEPLGTQTGRSRHATVSQRL